MTIIKLEFDIGTTDAECKLGTKVTFDNTVIYDNAHVTETYHLCHSISDQDAEHVLEIELYNKRPEHTQIDAEGVIVKDALITVQNVTIDGIDISSIINTYPNNLYSDVPSHLIQYHHDFNGTQPAIVDKFYGALGCNGVVRLKFTTPVYLWLLENM